MAKHFYLNRENALMKLRYAALVGVAAIGLTACSDDDKGNAAQPGVVNIRIVNSAYQDNGNGTYDPLSIDVLFDSSTSAPSQIGMAPNSIAGGSVGPSPAKLNALYGNLPVGVHSHVARVAGGTTNPSFFTTGSSTQYLPKQYLTAGTYYTFIVAGINPPQPTTGFTLASSDQFPFTLLVDDPFTPPATTATGSSVLQARFRFINAAPFAGGNFTSATIYILPATATSTTGYQNSGSVSFRSGSSYFNATAGTYQIFLVANGGTIYQGALTLSAGEVRTLILQNNGIMTVSQSSQNDPAFFKLTNIQDNQY